MISLLYTKQGKLKKKRNGLNIHNLSKRYTKNNTRHDKVKQHKSGCDRNSSAPGFLNRCREMCCLKKQKLTIVQIL